MPAKDILLDDNYNPVIVNGDFSIGDGTEQHQKLLILSAKGDFKLNPTAAVDVTRHLDDDAFNLLQEVSSEFTKDGMKVKSVGYEADGSLAINANY